jgi:hypothetical protein
LSQKLNERKEELKKKKEVKKKGLSETEKPWKTSSVHQTIGMEYYQRRQIERNEKQRKAEKRGGKGGRFDKKLDEKGSERKKDR